AREAGRVDRRAVVSEYRLPVGAGRQYSGSDGSDDAERRDLERSAGGRGTAAAGCAEPALAR
ncbi:hypothetical protein, partial [Burkholderia multivorans]|uniref:hypothetical protein n=1 Tax=Burkholderia multivorans TaxID=87883 RepID=UPI001C659E98